MCMEGEEGKEGERKKGRKDREEEGKERKGGRREYMHKRGTEVDDCAMVCN